MPLTDDKIYLMTYTEEGPLGDRVVVSHGVGNNTLKTHCLPPEPLSFYNPKHDEAGAYIDA